MQFAGLGGANMYSEDTADGLEFADMGIIHVIPYCNPWCCMNRQAINLVDEIIDV